MVMLSTLTISCSLKVLFLRELCVLSKILGPQGQSQLSRLVLTLKLNASYDCDGQF